MAASKRDITMAPLPNVTRNIDLNQLIHVFRCRGSRYACIMPKFANSPGSATHKRCAHCCTRLVG